MSEQPLEVTPPVAAQPLYPHTVSASIELVQGLEAPPGTLSDNDRQQLFNKYQLTSAYDSVRGVDAVQGYA